jgi:hypothetical protein
LSFNSVEKSLSYILKLLLIIITYKVMFFNINILKIVKLSNIKVISYYEHSKTIGTIGLSNIITASKIQGI